MKQCSTPSKWWNPGKATQRLLAIRYPTWTTSLCQRPRSYTITMYLLLLLFFPTIEKADITQFTRNSFCIIVKGNSKGIPEFHPYQFSVVTKKSRSIFTLITLFLLDNLKLAPSVAKPCSFCFFMVSFLGCFYILR